MLSQENLQNLDFEKKVDKSDWDPLKYFHYILA